MIDLTYPLEEGDAVFPEYDGFKSKVLESHKDNAEPSRVSHRFSANSHQGTHIDAPLHFIQEGKTIDEIDIDVLNGPARIVDLRNYKKEKITANILENTAPNIRENDRVILITGDVDRLFGTKNFFDNSTVLAPDAGEWLSDRGISMVACDFLTESISDPDRPVHHSLLGAGIPIVEYICNTETITQFTEVDLFCLPLLIPGYEAAPARVAARP